MNKFNYIKVLAVLLQACATTGTMEEKPTVVIKEVLPRIGIALGCGGARGFAEIGVLRVLEQEKIPIDVVVGTSVGSQIGAIYA